MVRRSGREVSHRSVFYQGLMQKLGLVCASRQAPLRSLHSRRGDPGTHDPVDEVINTAKGFACERALWRLCMLYYTLSNP